MRQRRADWLFVILVVGMLLAMLVGVSAYGQAVKPSVQFSTTSINIAEGDTRCVSFTRTGATTNSLEVDFNIDANIDGLSFDRAWTISAGDSTGRFCVRSKDDDDVHLPLVKTQTISITPKPFFYTIGTNGSATVTLTEDDKNFLDLSLFSDRTHSDYIRVYASKAVATQAYDLVYTVTGNVVTDTTSRNEVSAGRDGFIYLTRNGAYNVNNNAVDSVSFSWNCSDDSKPWVKIMIETDPPDAGETHEQAYFACGSPPITPPPDN